MSRKIVYNLLLAMFTRQGMSFITGAARIIRVYLNGYKAIKSRKSASTSITNLLFFSFKKFLGTPTRLALLLIYFLHLLFSHDYNAMIMTFYLEM